MQLIKLDCPYCNGELHVQAGTKECFCSCCGRKLLIDDGSRNVNVNVNKNVSYRDEARLKELELLEHERERERIEQAQKEEQNRLAMQAQAIYLQKQKKKNRTVLVLFVISAILFSIAFEFHIFEFANDKWYLIWLGLPALAALFFAFSPVLNNEKDPVGVFFWFYFVLVVVFFVIGAIIKVIIGTT